MAADIEVEEGTACATCTHRCDRAVDLMMASFELPHEQLSTLWSLLDYHAEMTPDRVAMTFETRHTSYRLLRDAAEALAISLMEKGVAPGDRIGYLGKNSDRYFALLFAVARMRTVLVPMGWRLSPSELSFIVDDAEIGFLFSDAEYAGQVEALAQGRDIATFVLDEASDCRASHSDVSPTLEGFAPAPDDVVFQVYTSGTTGHPKGAMLSHRNLLALRAYGYRAGLSWFPTPDSTAGVVLPVAHIAGTANAVFSFYAGGRVVIAREFDPGEVIALIEREGISHMLLAPSAMQMLLDHPSADSADLSALSYVTYGAAPIPEALLRRAIERIGCGFVQMYGMTEAAGGVVVLRPEDHVCGIPERLRSAGKAMPGAQIAIIDGDWNILPPRSTGEIVVRSPSIMQGYWKRPDATAEVFGPDGWMRTGDIGSIDDDGYLFVLDRAKDVIISGGENIYPAEVENAIFGHPDVVDVAVIGAPSAKWGEEVVAVIVPRAGTTPDVAALSIWLHGKLARFKCPKQVTLVSGLPRNAGNKILRRLLREPFWKDHDRQVN